jgi:3-hydroxyisobutyrate dehydrogenase
MALFPRAAACRALVVAMSSTSRRPPSLARALFSSFSSGAAAAAADNTQAPSSSSSPPPQPPQKNSIAFIGLGNMGLPMAVNLLRKGNYTSIVAVDVSDDSARQLEAEAMAAAAASSSSSPSSSPRVVRALTPRAALEDHPDVSAVVTMLPATRHAREVYEDEQKGVLAGLERRQHGPPVLLCDCSTVAPSFAAALTLKIPSPHLLVDAPVSGGVPAARAGTLTFMVGGSDGAFTAAEPLLALMGVRTVRCGPKNGAGLAAKVANNLALAVQYAGVCEALALGQKCGVDPLLLSNEVFAASSADCWAVRKYSPVAGASGGASPASRGYKAGFGAPLMVKDLELALELAEEVGVPAPLAEAAKRLYERVVEAALERGEDPRGVDFSRVFVDVYGGGVTVQ